MKITTPQQLRRAFWEAHKGMPGIINRRTVSYGSYGGAKMHNTDTRCAFIDYKANLSESGEISQELAARTRL